jgi:hypothetical protein
MMNTKEGTMKLNLAYCDKIAHEIRLALAPRDVDGIITEVGPIKWDLHPEGGYMVSTAKTIMVYDCNGKAYRVHVEEAPEMDKDLLNVVDMFNR